jgi:hypothetical protein
MTLRPSLSAYPLVSGLLGLAVVALLMTGCDSGGVPVPPDPTDPSIQAPSSVSFVVEPGGTDNQSFTVSYTDLDEAPAVELPTSDQFTVSEESNQNNEDENGDVSGQITYSVDYQAPNVGGASATVTVRGVNSTLGDTLETNVQLSGTLPIEPPSPAQIVDVRDFEQRSFTTGSNTSQSLSGDVADNSSGIRSREVTVGATGELVINRPVNVPAGASTDRLTFLAKGDTENSVRLTFTFRDDDDGNGTFSSASDDAFTAEKVIPGGTGWSAYEISLSELEDTNSGGNGTFDPNRVDGGGVHLALQIETELLGDGTGATFYLDEIALGTETTTDVMIDDAQEDPSFIYGFGGTEESGTSNDVAPNSTGSTSGVVTVSAPNASVSGFGYNHFDEDGDSFGANDGRGALSIPLDPSSDVMSFWVKSESASFELGVRIEEYDEQNQQKFVVTGLDVSQGSDWQQVVVPISAFEGEGGAPADALDPVDERAGGNGDIYNIGFEVRNASGSSEFDFLIDDIVIRRNVQ